MTERRPSRVRSHLWGLALLAALHATSARAGPGPEGGEAGVAAPGRAPAPAADAAPALEMEAAARDAADSPRDPGPTSVDPTAGSKVEGAGVVPFFGLLLNQDITLDSAAAGLTVLVNPFGLGADLFMRSLDEYQRYPAALRRAQFSITLPISEASLAAGNPAVDRLTVQVKAEALGRTDRRARMWNERYARLRDEAAAKVAAVHAQEEAELLRIGLEQWKIRRQIADLSAEGDPSRAELEARLKELEAQESKISTRQAEKLRGLFAESAHQGFRDLHAEIARQPELSLSVAGSWRFLDPETREESRGFVFGASAAGRWQLVGDVPVDLSASAGLAWSRQFASERALTLAAAFEVRLGGKRIPYGPIGIGIQVATDYRPEPSEERPTFSWSLTEVVTLPLQKDRFLRLALSQVRGGEAVGFTVGYTWVPASAGGAPPLAAPGAPGTAGAGSASPTPSSPTPSPTTAPVPATGGIPAPRGLSPS
ncbi:hypothetical protein L6R50_09400 [Myxococcota bacterium]|nr:hypothetical protein [Myxococcota bacterium]